MLQNKPSMLPHVLTHKYVTHYTGKMYKCVTREQKRRNVPPHIGQMSWCGTLPVKYDINGPGGA